MNYKLTREHIKLAIERDPKFQFMNKVVEDIPSLVFDERTGTV